ncbi:MAG: DHHW family protein [Firmicutes bacterium]|nr:DHHW family protein [Bacillota bacterium]
MEQQKKRARRFVMEQGAFLAIFLLLCLFAFVIANALARDREYSSAENRKLAQVPKFSLSALLDGSYFTTWEDYLADQFVGRDTWITIDLQASRLLGAKEAGGVYLCADDSLMEAPAAPDEAGVNRNLDAINGFAARHEDLRISMTVVPNAACVLAEKLPDNAPVRDQRQDIKDIAARLQGVDFLDVTDALAQHKDETIYYRTDHHWTSLGAYYAFSDMAAGLGIEQPTAEYDIYPVTDSFEGTLASKSGCHAVTDVIEVYVPKGDLQYYMTVDGERTATMYDREKLDEKDQYAVFLGGNDARVDITTTAETGKTLLIFKDSYANCFLQFLLPYYDRIILLDARYYYGDADSVISREGVTDVLFLYNANTFLTDRVLADVLAP